MYPTRKTLSRAFGPDTARKLRRALEDIKAAEEYAKEWVRQCYHRPSDDEIRMQAANVILNGHGVEAINPEDGEFRAWPVLTYVNMGGTYDSTLIAVYNGNRNVSRFIVSSWGDEVERRGL